MSRPACRAALAEGAPRWRWRPAASSRYVSARSSIGEAGRGMPSGVLRDAASAMNHSRAGDHARSTRHSERARLSECPSAVTTANPLNRVTTPPGTRSDETMWPVIRSAVTSATRVAITNETNPSALSAICRLAWSARSISGASRADELGEALGVGGVSCEEAPRDIMPNGLTIPLRREGAPELFVAQARTETFGDVAFCVLVHVRIQQPAAGRRRDERIQPLQHVRVFSRAHRAHPRYADQAGRSSWPRGAETTWRSEELVGHG